MVRLTHHRHDSSNKLFFSIDGKSRIADTTTLSYYMSLTPQGQAILALGADKPAAAAAAADDKKDNVDASKPGVNTFTLKVTDGTSAPLIPLPAANEALSKLLAGISQGSLQKGQLPTFTDREMASLKASYAVNPGSAAHPEPVDLTELQWDKVFANNRALHGYYYDFDKNILVKARKRAFKLRGAAPVGKAPVSGEDQGANKVRSFPSFTEHMQTGRVELTHGRLLGPAPSASVSHRR